MRASRWAASRRWSAGRVAQLGRSSGIGGAGRGVGWGLGRVGVISISSARGDEMLLYYGTVGGGRAEQCPESAECVKAHAGLVGESEGGTGRRVEHPGGDLQGSDRLGIKAAVADELPVTRNGCQDVNLPP